MLLLLLLLLLVGAPSLRAHPHTASAHAPKPRLAAFICGYSTVTIVISGGYSLSNFREDLQRMYRRAGLKGEGLLFLLTDSQVGVAWRLGSGACGLHVSQTVGASGFNQ